MNWTLPLLFILLSPGFLISLGSKSKVSIMTILIHAVIFAIIINVYGTELEGFQTSDPIVSTENTSTDPIVLAMSMPAAANTFYQTNVARDPTIASNTKLLPDDPTKPSPSGSQPSQHQKNTLLLSFILPAFYKDNLKYVCNMKDPTGAPAEWVPAAPLAPNPPTCPKCPETPTNKSAAATFCTIM
jgi:hypothetical protein